MDLRTAQPYAETVPNPYAQELAEAVCDRCGVAARFLIALGNARLALCRHHWIKHEDELTKAGWRVLADSTIELTLR